MEPLNHSSGKYSFRELGLWQKAQSFAVDIVRLVEGLPRRRSTDVIGRQLIRAASSIAANVAEGHGRYTLAAYRNHLQIAKGSASESLSWLDLLLRLGQIEAGDGKMLEDRCEELIAALTRRIRMLERAEQNRRLRDDVAHYNVDDRDQETGSKVQGFQGQVE